MSVKGVLFALLLLPAGCSYLSQRAEDFGDCWKGELKATVGLAGVQAGPIAHAGLMAEDLFIFGITITGWRYGYDMYDLEHGHAPLHGYGLFTHYSDGDARPEEAKTHQCYVLFPTLLCREGIHRNVLHDFDLDVGAGFLLGVSLGFSPGEFLDFLLGWFGVDIAGDDDPVSRKARNKPESYFHSKAGVGPILPRKTTEPAPPE